MDLVFFGFYGSVSAEKWRSPPAPPGRNRPMG
jgi:hypothetical protein